MEKLAQGGGGKELLFLLSGSESFMDYDAGGWGELKVKIKILHADWLALDLILTDIISSNHGLQRGDLGKRKKVAQGSEGVKTSPKHNINKQSLTVILLHLIATDKKGFMGRGKVLFLQCAGGGGGNGGTGKGETMEET